MDVTTTGKYIVSAKQFWINLLAPFLIDTVKEKSKVPIPGLDSFLTY